MNKRKLRRVAIVVLVLVNAIDQASNLDTVLIGAVIQIPEGASLGDGSKTIILKSSGGYMEIVENTQSEESCDTLRQILMKLFTVQNVSLIPRQ